MIFVIINVSSECVRSTNKGSGHHMKNNKYVQC